jgi:hypothetical protein
MKKREYEQTSEAIFLWLTQRREESATTARIRLQEKALVFHRELREVKTDYAASTGRIGR